MKEETRKRLSQLILEELSEKIKTRENLRHKLEAFTDLPIEKVADAILNQFEYVLSSDLRDLIIYLIEQEVSAEQQAVASTESIEIPPPPEAVPEMVGTGVSGGVIQPTAPVVESESVMERFATKDPFAAQPTSIELLPDDWLYLYGFSYAPDSTGKGLPTKQLPFKGIDGTNDVIVIDYGDVRFFLNRLNIEDYTLDKSHKPVVPIQTAAQLKLAHEKILNVLRADDAIVPLAFWSIVQNRERLIQQIEDQYVELLRALIDVHDAVDWDVEVFAFDQHIVELPSIAEVSKTRTTQRETKHQVGKSRDVKVMEKLIMREKAIAQEVHSQLLLHSTKTKLDFIIRLDNAFMDDWKSILSARYNVSKDKRKNFCQAIRTLQDEYQEFQLMFRVMNPNIRFTLAV